MFWKKINKEKIAKYIYDDYGIDIIKVENRLNELYYSKPMEIVKIVLLVITILFFGGLTAGVLAIFFLAHTLSLFLLLMVDLWLVTLTYYYLNDKIDIEYVEMCINKLLRRN